LDRERRPARCLPQRVHGPVDRADPAL